jgi:ATP-binding cassette subfamily B protein
MVFGFAQQQIAERLSYQIEFDLRVWLYTHIQSAELRRLDALASGQLVTRSLTDVQLVETLLRIFPTLVGFVPVLIAIAVIVIIISPIMGVLTLVAFPINLWLLHRFRHGLRALSWAELRAAESQRDRRAGARHPRVKAFGREDKERAADDRARLLDEPLASPATTSS